MKESPLAISLEKDLITWVSSQQKWRDTIAKYHPKLTEAVGQLMNIISEAQLEAALGGLFTGSRKDLPALDERMTKKLKAALALFSADVPEVPDLEEGSNDSEG